MNAYYEKTAELLEAIEMDLRSERDEADARQHAGTTPEGISSDDFEGAAYDDGIVAGLTVALDRIGQARESLASLQRLGGEGSPG